MFKCDDLAGNRVRNHAGGRGSPRLLPRIRNQGRRVRKLKAKRQKRTTFPLGVMGKPPGGEFLAGARVLRLQAHMAGSEALKNGENLVRSRLSHLIV